MNLLEKNVEDLLEWVKLASDRRVDLPKDFSWYSLSSGIISRLKVLIRDGQLECVTAWSKVINEIYNNIASDNPNSSEREALQYELMHIRAALIMKFGVSKSESLLDEGPLLTWFFHGLNVPLDTAIQKSDDWQILKQDNKIECIRAIKEKQDNAQENTTMEDLRALRKIKNKLSILKPLYQNKLIENKELGDWISIMYKLP